MTRIEEYAHDSVFEISSGQFRVTISGHILGVHHYGVGRQGDCRHEYEREKRQQQ
jgi:hypothetical protein